MKLIIRAQGLRFRPRWVPIFLETWTFLTPTAKQKLLELVEKAQATKNRYLVTLSPGGEVEGVLERKSMHGEAQ